MEQSVQMWLYNLPTNVSSMDSHTSTLIQLSKALVQKGFIYTHCATIITCYAEQKLIPANASCWKGRRKFRRKGRRAYLPHDGQLGRVVWHQISDGGSYWFYDDRRIINKTNGRGLTQRGSSHGNVCRVTDQTNSIGQYDMYGVV